MRPKLSDRSPFSVFLTHPTTSGWSALLCARMTLLCRNSPFCESIHKTRLGHTFDPNFNLTSPPHNGPVIRQIIGVTNNRNSQRESGPNYAETGGTIGPCGSPGGKILNGIQNTKHKIQNTNCMKPERRQRILCLFIWTSLWSWIKYYQEYTLSMWLHGRQRECFNFCCCCFVAAVLKQSFIGWLRQRCRWI